MSDQLLEPLKSLFKNAQANSIDLRALKQVYSNDIIFVDPVHQLKGVDELHAYLSDMYQNTLSCQFNYIEDMFVVSKNDDEQPIQSKATLKWDMFLKHKRLKGGNTITVRGMSLIHMDHHKVIYHEDVYDLGALLYENIPLLNLPVRWLKSRLST